MEGAAHVATAPAEGYGIKERDGNFKMYVALTIV
jgi:hypothetical protein